MINIALQKITTHDLEFLFKVYASTRIDELIQTGWSLERQEEFLRMQFSAQHEHYQKFYPEASYNLILLDDQVVGRLYISRWTEEIRIVDIALLSEFRGKKIGTLLMQDLFAEAKKKKLEVSIHVEKNNPALKWYQSLGFKEIEDKGVYSLMQTNFY